MEKFNNKYRTKSNRMPLWDYAGNGMYFITIVTRHRVCVFGEIKNKQMICSEFGKIASNEWLKSFDLRKELFLDTFIIMPNHLHALIKLEKNGGCNQMNIANVPNDSDGSHDGRSHDGRSHDGRFHDGRFHVETHGRASPHAKTGENRRKPDNPTKTGENRITQRKPKSISSFIGGYKSAVTSEIDDFIDDNNIQVQKYNRNNKLWQPDYHDHIVRNKSEYYRIKNYIKNNPKNWVDDKFYK